MTDRTVDEPATSARTAGLTWNKATLDELRMVLGDEKVDGILSRFWRDLCPRFGNKDDAEALRRDAHVVTSTAGMLGFESLGEAARSLEAACLEGRPFKILAETLHARRDEVGRAMLRR